MKNRVPQLIVEKPN
jgi:hypothetical protein